MPSAPNPSLPDKLKPDLSNLNPEQRKVLRLTLAEAPPKAQFKLLLEKGLSRHQAGSLLHSLALR